MLRLLADHPAADEAEARDVAFVADFVAAHPDCLGKANPAGHITASAFVTDPAGRVLMTHHAKLHRWLQVGGHTEPGEWDPADAAWREAHEESGLDDLVFVGPRRPIDVDVHRIPARKADAAHDHLDLRYVLRTERPEAIAITAESNDLRWFTFDELRALDDPDLALRRALAKVEAALAG
jgi:8-oxo-dGTP pyrophosphatase MutT (NUDIX family)